MKAGAYIELEIHEIIQVSRGVKLFYFTEESSSTIAYKAGQYLTFIWGGEQAEIRRSYSLASVPQLDKRLCIGVKRIDNGSFSRRLVDHAKVGDRLLTIGAGGIFTLPENADEHQHIFFFAAGSGIVPIFSLLRSVLFFHPSVNVILIYSNSSPATTIFFEEINELRDRFPTRFVVEFLFSNAQNLFRARLHGTLIQELVESLCPGEWTNAFYYICGPESYMRLCTYTLRRLQVPAGNLKKEIFHTTRSVKKIEPPDKNEHCVTIFTGPEKHMVMVQHPVSILQAARAIDLQLPYSCEAGRCGNCIAKCISGKVWMSYNEVLTEKEIAGGYVLTCTGYPVDGDAVIRI